VTVLRPDIVDPEPIHEGAGWAAYDAPTRPAGPNPLTMHGSNGVDATNGGTPNGHATGATGTVPDAAATTGTADTMNGHVTNAQLTNAQLTGAQLMGAQANGQVANGQVANGQIANGHPVHGYAPSGAAPEPVALAEQAGGYGQASSFDQASAFNQAGTFGPVGGFGPGGFGTSMSGGLIDAGLADSSKLIRLHESIAALLASRGEWRQAYQHLRSALDLVYSDRVEQPPVPEQLRREVDRLRREHAEAREQSIRDSLTASYNRRYLDQRLTSLLADTTGANGRDGLAVALVDLDWFKQVNDTFGHLVGDRVLQRVVDLLSDGLPVDAFCARYGGEEFVLVVPGIDAATAVDVAEAARDRVARYAWSQLVPGLRVTVSIGVAHQPGGGTGVSRPATSAEQQLLRADGLLYAAKQSGRNAVAYRHAGQVLLTGAAADRRWAEPRTAVTPNR
jgi:two-component system cell cycle response regulator